MAFQDLIKYGVNTQGDRFAGLGEAAQQGFLEGEQRVQDMQDRVHLENERQRLADERETEELDAFYGDVYVPPTGQVGYDAGVEMMAREWKSEFAAATAAKKAGQLSNDEYVQLKHELRNRAQTLKQGQQYLGQFKQLFDQAKAEGMLSKSTPAKIRLLGEALERGEVQIENIDGRPTVVGQLADGEPVQIDMAALASGQANLRINQKVDVSGLTNTIAKTLEGYKTTIATENGLALGNVGWEQIENRAAEDIQSILNNSSTVQAIAADELELNPEAIAALGPEELENRVGDYLLDKVQQEYFPTQVIDKFTGLTEYQSATLDQNQQRIDNNLGVRSSAPNASLINIQLDQQQKQNISNVINAGDPNTGSLAQLNGVGGYNIEFDEGFFGSNQYIITDSKGNKQKLTPEEAKSFLHNTLVGVPGQQPSQGAATDESNPLGI